jgi:beta-glucosidase
VRSIWVIIFVGSVLSFTLTGWAAEPFRDTAQPTDTRVRDLVSRLTLQEKTNLMGAFNPGVPRLGIAPYIWWNEALHGIARAGEATVFPQAIGLAATFDADLMHTVADAIGTEGRAKFHEADRRGLRLQFWGLNFWSPNINIFRDPRWGRGQETYGEDPFLTSRMGVAFVEGLQGDDPNYLKVAATAKHFAVHSGPERIRRSMDNSPSAEDFHDTYLPAFEALVREAHVAGVMTAYNSLYGKPCAINPILYDLLYHKWGFEGYVVSDCGAMGDLYNGYHLAKDAAEAEAMATNAGLTQNCGREAPALVDAVQRGLVDEKTIDLRCAQLLRTQFRLGLFDPPGACPYASIPFSENGSQAHSQIALEAARESIVLLKNDGTLPLDATKLHRVAVIGPNARSVTALLGNYNGTPRFPITILDGLRTALGPDVQLECIQGCAYIDGIPGAPPDSNTAVENPAETPEAAIAAARRADVVIYVGGLSADIEGEAGNNGYEDFDGRDRTRIELPPPQEKMLEALQATGKPVVYVNMSGSCIAFSWAAEHVNAIVQTWYPGENGGTAVADVLLGKFNPAGRLPVTFYRSTADLPPFEDYAMKNRTYRFFTGTPLYPFGFGLSYTSFRYDHLRVVRSATKANVVTVSFDLTNTGQRKGDEVAQVYVREPESAQSKAKESLAAFKRVHLEAGETKRISLEVTSTALRRWNSASGHYVIADGSWTFAVGASSVDLRQAQTIALSGMVPDWEN